MAMRDLLVLLDEGKAQPTLEAACDLASRLKAQVTALGLRPRRPLPGFIAAELPGDLLAGIAASDRDAATQQRRGAEAVAARHSVAFTWQDMGGDVANATETLAIAARYADLLVVGQPPIDSAGEGRAAMVETLLVGTGRPVLVVPSVGAPAGFGSRVLLAWDGGREAARAVADALPLLRAADHVEVVTVDAARRFASVETEPGSAITAHLVRHGVKASLARLTSGPLSIGDLLLNRASDRGQDLIVMGAYAHSRLRDLVLGGVTRHMLKHMTVPIFAAH